jgi:tetratricopeptide (TPR) repeat protein
VVDHIRQRYEAAQQRPDVATINALCTAYQADMFFDAAESCYASMDTRFAPDWRRTYSRAIIRSDRGGGPELVALLQQVVDASPGFAPAWLRLGDAAFKQGDYDRAAMAWSRAATLPEPEPPSGDPPHHPEAPLPAYATLGVARVALTRGDAAGARTILQEIVGNVPDFGPAWRLVADTYASDAPEARRALYLANKLPAYAPYADPFVDALARESRNSTFLLRLASEADLARNGPWAEFLTRRALRFDPQNPDVVSKLGRVLRTLGRNDEALAYFRRYNDLVPGDYQGLAQTASCLSALWRYDEAEPLFRRALPHLDDATTHFNLGLLLAQTGRLQEAEGEYRTALARDDTHADARINLAAMLARRGQAAAAAAELRRVLAADPENPLARQNLRRLAGG